MKTRTCPVCQSPGYYEEISHTIKSRGNPDKTMTFTKKGYRCSDHSFFFSDQSDLKEEEKVINRFANQA
jgi:hypothetical protein